MITHHKQRTTLWVRCNYLLIGLMLLTLTGCQHIQLAHSPLPVTLHPPKNTSQPPYVLSCKDTSAKNRQAPTLCTNKNKQAFYILEDWF